MADEGLHEIQLNGKQLVFLFMASTVVAVVIFLCGVMVGRGVRTQRPVEPIEAAGDVAVDPTAVDKPLSTSAPVPTATTPGNAPVAANEILTYPSRLEGQDVPDEKLKPRSVAKDPASPVATSAKLNPPVAKSLVPKESATAAKANAPAEPAGGGFVVQVAAVNNRGEADAIARRLTGKGYPTFVTTPRGGVPRMFRVRIGKYQTRREAETIAARLQKEDQFKPWITR